MRRTLVLTLVCALAPVSTAAAQGLVHNGRPLREALSVKHTLKTPPPAADSSATALVRDGAPEREASSKSRLFEPSNRRTTSTSTAARQNGMSKKTKVLLVTAVIVGATVGIIALSGGYDDDDSNGPYQNRR